MDEESLKSEIADSWSAEADYYDSLVSHGVQTTEEKKLWIEAFRAVLPVKDRPLDILDVGCGTGAMGLILSEMGHNVTGLDISESMMDIGRKKAQNSSLSMIFQKGDAERPPFSDNTFDCVVNRHLLWTLPNPKEALDNWCRVIRPKGKVLVIDGLWDDGSLSTKLKRETSLTVARIVEKHPHGESKYSDELSMSLPNLKGVPEEKAGEYFSEAGLEDISVKSLLHIRENQKKRLKWYQKLNTSWSYYLISGVKRG
ncbi:ubiquinone/menaquinone biosynthesis C-methylase UbiE [Methanomicrobium sp. W14]|uniref:class I SAM-dependent methyltransferase n=1 Tax=Methanomicrobium sp. W14 TaxID=2817839 RepID=UPI001AE84A83|nr:class I SAM-dependent methyltransferase [Methanomicrobium sp. W14]MBP2132213.1 ubiquinone/menaquinone biosynthesis C-methylase UbiE [Methanomicrobium sp. W14]